jgi:nucleoside-diphosphate-sugar epimerase
MCLQCPKEKIAGKVFNAGYENHTVSEIAQAVKDTIGDPNVTIVTEPTNDNRSYHVSSEKIKKELGFVPKHTIEEAVNDLLIAFKAGKLSNSLTDPRYYNIQVMKAVQW